jgi:eukaryotic-like serine/threonine-protein kinase
MASLCQQYKNRYAVAVRLYHEAFQGQPALAENQVRRYRYNAACAAALASTGTAEESIQLPAEEKHRLRQQALTWLQADLDTLRKLATSDKPAEPQQAQRTLTRWLQDSDLVPVRDPACLKTMPDDERKAWQALWADVQEVLQKLKEPKK